MATAATTPKNIAPTTSWAISGFALPPVIHNNQPNPIGFLFLKLPPPPCAVLLVYTNVELVYPLSKYNPCILMLLYSICGRDVVLLRPTCYNFCFTVASALPCCRAKKVGLKIWTLKGLLKWISFPWGSMISQSFNVLQTGEWGNPQFFLPLWDIRGRRRSAVCASCSFFLAYCSWTQTFDGRRNRHS